MPEPLPIRHLHHIARTTRRPDESRDFYCQVLGFREMPRPVFDFRGSWLYGYDVQIHIIENTVRAGDPDPDHIDTRDNHIAFAVEDQDAVKTRLEHHGVPYREQVNAGGTHQIFFQDPDGHHIEVAVYGSPEEPIV